MVLFIDTGTREGFVALAHIVQITDADDLQHPGKLLHMTNGAQIHLSQQLFGQIFRPGGEGLDILRPQPEYDESDG